jgi:hypothetical protein
MILLTKIWIQVVLKNKYQKVLILMKIEICLLAGINKIIVDQ